MLAYAALGLVTLGLVYLLGRWFATIPARDLALALKTFVAVFTALTSTGLVLTGRLGLALVTLAATVVAVRAVMQSRRGADPLGPAPGSGRISEVETDLLRMRLAHASGEVEGEVRAGPFAGRELGSLGLRDLLALLDEARREDPRSVPLLEAYLDRREPGWREAAEEAGRAGDDASPAPAAMDERTALEILGLEPGASEAEIRAAHRRLMARLHPDHGGSSYLASQINRARDYLLRPHR
ncbi:DnaJ domain-containing protein [Benzoatithermus flavus]|uniref:DnaJ domain-containing protein n=1 Tax=Benzoatithermus flavus TaxID=3108223 RepID=A0ABU8XX68_9PROT